MQIRILRLRNNFYKSDSGVIAEESVAESKKALGSYCVFGHFDALEVEDTVELEPKESRIWESLVKNRLSRGKEESSLEEGYMEQNLVCIVRQGKSDAVFWEKAKEVPFLFVSFIYFEQSKDFEKVSKQLEEDDKNVFIYLSYGHNKITAVTYSQTYREGREMVMKLRDVFSVQKMHTLFAVREDRLENSGSSEQVNCRWQGILKPMADAERFIQELADKLHLPKKNPLIWYDQFGNNDVLVEANDIALKDLLPLYKMGNFMTHTNGQYKDTWVNIETNIFMPEGKQIYEKGRTETDQRTESDQRTDSGAAKAV